jgi:undecaprenyl-diphosphatase
MVLLGKALVMGIVEGLTEFLPISSTGHLILTAAAIGYPEAQRNTMEIFIQLGAILAVLWHYGTELRRLAERMPAEARARNLVLKVLAAFLPAAVMGLLFHHAIEERLWNPTSVAVALVVGGIVLLVVDRSARRARVHDIEQVSWGEALGIGVVQVASLVPGVSRAGATIVGGLLVGLDRPAATQFSFYLALPTVGAASLYSLWKGLPVLGAADVAPLAVGFLAAFASALLVIRTLLVYVRSHDFRVFAYYRIVLGLAVYVLLR